MDTPPLPVETTETPDDNDEAAPGVVVYSCRRCRTRLFDEQDLTFHEAERHALSYRRLKKDQNQGSTLMNATEEQEEETCKSHFLTESLGWMDLGDSEGKLLCPGCACRLGSFSWSGAQCSCGTWVTPSLRIPKSKVDDKRLTEEQFSAWKVTLDSALGNLQLVDGDRSNPGDIDCENTTDGDEHMSLEATTTSADGSNTTHGNEATTNNTPDPTIKRLPEKLSRVDLHAKWLLATQQGDLVKVGNMIDQDECSLTTVRGKIIDGFEDVQSGLAVAMKQMRGRMIVHPVNPSHGPVQLSSGATRVLYSLRNLKDPEMEPVVIGEAIFWSSDDQVQHVMRKAKANASFLGR